MEGGLRLGGINLGVDYVRCHVKRSLTPLNGRAEALEDLAKSRLIIGAKVGIK